MKVTFKYDGFVSRSPTPICDTEMPGNCTNVNLNELILVCDSDIQASNPLGQAYGRISGDYEDYPNTKPLADRAVIVFYKGSNGGEWDWVFSSPSSVDDKDFYSVLLHEIGHIYGLMHTCELVPSIFWTMCAQLPTEERAIAERTIMYPSLSVAYPWNRTGPQTKDIERMREAWNSFSNPRTDVDIKLGYSYGSNDSWSELTIDTSGSVTFQSPSVAYGPALYDDVWLAYFVNIIYWVQLRSGDGVHMNNITNFYDMETNHSPGIGIIGNKIMVAAVNRTFDHTAGAGRQINIKYTPNGGTNWYGRTSISANTPTRVDVAVTELTSGQDVWIVAWTDAETFEAKAALSIDNGVTWHQRNFRNELAQTNLKAVGALDVACNFNNTCQLAYREWSETTNQWLGFRSLHFYIGIFINYPLLFSDNGGPVVISNYYNGGMPARVFMESLASIGPSIDYHVNTGYGGYNRTTRSWRKLQGQSPAPNTYSFIGPILETNYDIINSIELNYLGFYPYLFGYFAGRD
jgi:hypothetical protein